MALAQRVSPDEALERVRAALGDSVTDGRIDFGQVHVVVEPAKLADAARILKEELGFVFFTFLSAIDWTAFEGRESEGLELLVHLYAPDSATHVNVRVPLGVPGEKAISCQSITGVFKGALWHEREMHDMFGIGFEGHPHLVNLYLPEDFEGHPLLKSFQLPSRALVKPWPGAKDPDEAAAGGR